MHIYKSFSAHGRGKVMERNSVGEKEWQQDLKKKKLDSEILICVEKNYSFKISITEEWLLSKNL